VLRHAINGAKSILWINPLPSVQVCSEYKNTTAKILYRLLHHLKQESAFGCNQMSKVKNSVCIANDKP
jgi:hypothetical protein